MKRRIRNRAFRLDAYKTAHIAIWVINEPFFGGCCDYNDGKCEWCFNALAQISPFAESQSQYLAKRIKWLEQLYGIDYPDASYNIPEELKLVREKKEKIDSQLKT